ncbi:MAG: hypothetical protein E4H19_08885 [Chromatiales bacterium]|nr:MAG: hypothetical protein E4H19_08885 [Chromatiales bacterium]
MSIRILLALMAAASVYTAHAQTAPVAAPTGQKSLSATMNVYVFPNSGQAPAQQSKDEGECYNWAVQNTGSDPFQIEKESEQQQQQTAQQQEAAKEAGKGSGARGAVGGAAAGALIGAIAGDAGKGAVIGAGVGLVGGRGRARRQQTEATEQAEQQGQAAAQASAGQLDNFKKAFSVCLEAKKYMVKY